MVEAHPAVSQSEIQPMTKLRNGHAPGHIRSAFLDAVWAYQAWEEGEPEPCVDVEIRYEPHSTPIGRVCGMLWNCTDIIPGLVFDTLADCGLDVGRRTYAACAQAMKAEIERSKAVAF